MTTAPRQQLCRGAVCDITGDYLGGSLKNPFRAAVVRNLAADLAEITRNGLPSGSFVSQTARSPLGNQAKPTHPPPLPLLLDFDDFLNRIPDL